VIVAARTGEFQLRQQTKSASARDWVTTTPQGS
jgi:hypothetical protein